MVIYIEQNRTAIKITYEELVNKIVNNELSPDTPIITEQMSVWAPLGTTEEWRKYSVYISPEKKRGKLLWLAYAAKALSFISIVPIICCIYGTVAYLDVAMIFVFASIICYVIVLLNNQKEDREFTKGEKNFRCKARGVAYHGFFESIVDILLLIGFKVWYIY